MSILKEFKEFAVRGNVIDLAVGVIIGASFGKIISSLVNDIIMPPLGYIIGGMDFKDLTLRLNNKVVIKYGIFINSIIDFILVALAIFLAVKFINKLRKPAPSTTKSCPSCLSDIHIDAKRCAYCTQNLTAV